MSDHWIWKVTEVFFVAMSKREHLVNLQRTHSFTIILEDDSVWKGCTAFVFGQIDLRFHFDLKQSGTCIQGVIFWTYQPKMGTNETCKFSNSAKGPLVRSAVAFEVLWVGLGKVKGFGLLDDNSRRDNVPCYVLS